MVLDIANWNIEGRPGLSEVSFSLAAGQESGAVCRSRGRDRRSSKPSRLDAIWGCLVPA